MKINIDNYKETLGALLCRIDGRQATANKDVEDTFAKVRELIARVADDGDKLNEANSTLNIGVVGQVKAGKSSFLNSMFFNGENVLPRASTPMTAGLTVLKYGDENQFEVEYYSKREWQVFEDKAKEYDDTIQSRMAEDPNLTAEDVARSESIDSDLKAAKELVTRCGRNAAGKIADKAKTETRGFNDIKDLQDILEDYVGADGSFTPIVKCLTIMLHDERLRDIQIVDTPGVNDPVVSREMRTREYLRNCHGVFFLSYSGRFFDSTDVCFLTDRIGSQGIGTVVLIASKFDSVLQDVGMSFKDDLSNALDHCTKSLKKQYQTNISKSDFSGKDPLLEFSSGIGYSIAQKEQSRWDEIETHVVKRMQAFYPGYFSSPDEIKDTFRELSQIDEIRDKYVEGAFKGKKDEIIQDKLTNFFKNSTAGLRKEITRKKDALDAKASALRNSNISEMEQTKKKVEQLIKDIKSSFQTKMNIMDDNAERIQKECWNGFVFNPRIPASNAAGEFSCKGGFLGWGTKTFTCEYRKFEKNTAADKICEDWTKTVNSLQDKWNKGISAISDGIKKNLQATIKECQMGDSDGLIDARVMYNILEESYEKIKNNATLNTKDLTDNFKSALADSWMGIKDLPHYYDMKESEAKDKIKECSQKQRDEAESNLRQVKSSQEEAVKEELKKCREAATSVLKDRKAEFYAVIEKDTKNYLDNLEEQLKDKKENERVMKESLILLEEIIKAL